MDFSLLLGLYVLSVIVSWLFMRVFYIWSGESAKYYPHYGTLLIIMIPFLNVLLSFGMAIIEGSSHLLCNLPKLNYKKVFKLK